MAVDIGRALEIAAQAIGDYGQYQFRRQAYDEDRADQQEQRDWERTFRTAEAAADRERERQARIDRDRQFYGTQTDRERDRLARMGVMPGAGFGGDFKATMLPDVTPGISDTGGMVLQGLKQQGQAGTQELYGALPDAMNRLVAGKGVSEALPGGGMVMMEPSVRASLMNAETGARVARENRKAAMARAQYRAEHPVARAENLEGRRVAFIAKRAGELMKPQTAIDAGIEYEIGPGLAPDAAYGQAAEEWELVRGGSEEDVFAGVVGGSSSTARASRGFSGSGPHSAPAAPSMPQDEALAQRWDELTTAGVPPDEATQRVLQDAQARGDVLDLPPEVTPTVPKQRSAAPRDTMSAGPHAPPQESRSFGSRLMSDARSLGEIVTTPLGELFPALYAPGPDTAASPSEQVPSSFSPQSQEILSRYLPPPLDPLAERRAAWDRLAELYGTEHTTREVGPRP